MKLKLSFFVMAFIAILDDSIAILDGFRPDSCVIQSGGSGDCPLSSMTRRTQVDPGGNTGCIFGDKYFFKVYPPNDRAADKTKNVVIYFQGFGICFNRLTCEFGTLARNLFARGTPQTREDGMFDKSDSRNPFQDWTIIHINYCTSDSHLGDNTRTFGGNDEYQFNGRNNALAALNWTFENVPAPERLVIAGQGMGSLGSRFWTQRILQQYHAQNVANPPITTVINTSDVMGRIDGPKEFDEYEGYNLILNIPESDSPFEEMMDNWEVCKNKDDFGWTNEQFAACQSYELTVEQAQLDVQAMYLSVAFANVHFKDDIDLKAFHICPQVTPTLFKFYFLGVRCEQKQLYEQWNDIIETWVDAGHQNVLTYWMNEPPSYHNVLDRNLFYRAASGDSEPKLFQWVDGLIHREADDTYDSSCVPRDEPGIVNGRIGFGPYDFGCRFPPKEPQFVPVYTTGGDGGGGGGVSGFR